MSDNFDFEQQIYKCWNLTDDIADLSEAISEGRVTATDDIVNTLNGLETIYSIKFLKLWDLYETVIMDLVRDEKLAREDANALREQLIYETQGYGIAAIKPNKKDKK